MADTYVELENSRDHSVDQYGRWRGVKEFSSPTADVETNRELIRALTWAVNSVTLRPRRVYVTWKNPQCPGNSIIRAEYSSPEDVAKYQVGKAYLSIRSTIRQKRMIYDYSGTPLGVYTPPAADGTYFRPIDRDADLAVDFVTQATWRLTTAYPTTAIDMAEMDLLLGKANAEAFTINSKEAAAVATLKLVAWEIPQWFLYDADSLVIPIQYSFLYRPQTWRGLGGTVNGTDLKTAAGFASKRERVMVKRFALHPDDDPTQATRHYMKPDGSDAGNSTTYAKWRLFPVERAANMGADTGLRIVGSTGDFSTLFGMLAWTP